MSLYERVTTCSLAMKYIKGDKDFISSYDEVMKFSENNDIENKNKNLTKACLKYLKEGFYMENRDRESNLLLCIAIELSTNTTNKLILEFYNHLDTLDDFDRENVKNIFNFSIINERVICILKDAMNHEKKNISKNKTRV